MSFKLHAGGTGIFILLNTSVIRTFFVGFVIESKGDGTVDASDSDDEWTFDNYRGKPEGGDSEAADNSSVVEVS